MSGRAHNLKVALCTVLAVAAGALVATALLVQLAIRPARRAAAPMDLDALGVRAESVRFPAVDGIGLGGLWLEGASDGPAIVLCHGAGSGMDELVTLALRVREAGFPVLLFDFRGHGESGGSHTTFGVEEKRDVFGALDFLRGQGAGRQPVGIYGVGMGAHAAVLAAVDRPAIKVLVLEGMYPDASYALARRFWRGWQPGVDHLRAVPATVFGAMTAGGGPPDRAGRALSRLSGRQVLLLAPEDDPELVKEMRAIYAGIPDRPDFEGNLKLFPATYGDGLRGAALDRHHDEVVEFFRSRLDAFQ